MAYSTQTDLEYAISQDSLIQLTDDSGAGSVDTDVTAWAIAKADSLINSYLTKQISTPLDAPVPTIVQETSVDLAVYYIYKRRRDVASDDLDDGINERYDNAISWLRDVAKGVVEMGIDTHISTGGRYQTSKTSSDRVYTDSCLDKY